MNNIKKYLKYNPINGIVKININNKKFFKKNGYSIKSKKLKYTKDTIFPLGSISKLIYGTIMVELLDKYKIKSLNEKVSKYLKDFKNIKCFNKITILECLLHTSGIKSIRDNDMFNKNKKYNINQFINLIENNNLYDISIHKKYNYSIANFFIIGKIIDVITGSCKKYIKKLCNKLKIKEIYFIDEIYDNNKNIKPEFTNKFAIGYSYKDDINDNNLVIKKLIIIGLKTVMVVIYVYLIII